MPAKDVLKDEVVPEGKWKFDGDVTEAFDDMLERSIPQYEVMRETVAKLAEHFIKPNTAIVDLGCSRGEAMVPLIAKFGAHNRFVGVEVSKPMLETSRKRFEGYINCGVVEILDLDLRNSYPPVHASITLAILTIMFIPIEYRLQVLHSIYESTMYDGALIMVEKVLGNSARLDQIMVDEYLQMKRVKGYTDEQIERKRLSLEGVLVPVTAKWNEELLKMAGFREVDCFWRWCNFAGWVAIK